MANQWNNPVVIADKMLEYFDDVSEVASVINRDYDSAFEMTPEGHSVGQVVYVEKPPRFVAQDGPEITAIQDINVGKVPVMVDKWKTVPVKLTGLDLTFNAKQFDIWAEKYLKPLVSPLANAVDLAVFGLYNQIYNHVGTPTTGPTTYDVPASAKELLTLMNTPPEDRVMFLNPTGVRKLTNGISGGFNPQGDIGTMWKTGNPFRIAGFEVREANNVATHTVGTAVTNSGSMQIDGASQVGSTLKLKNVATGTTFTKGDVITLTGAVGTGCYSVNPTSKQSTGILQEFVVTATTTAVSNAILALPISPAIITSGAFQNVDQSPADSAVVVRMTGAVSTTPAQNLAFWKKALGLVTVKIKAPKGLNAVTRTYKNMSLTISYGPDIMKFQEIWRADICFGVVCFYPENCVRITN